MENNNKHFMKIIIKHFLWLGLLFIVIGFLYDVYFVNVPFQDPPPELLKKYVFHKNVSDIIFYFGVILLVISIIARIIKSKKK